MFYHFRLFLIPVGLQYISHVPSSVQQLPCKDNSNIINNKNNKVNAYNDNNNIPDTQSKSTANDDSLGGFVLVRDTNSLAGGIL